MNVLFTGDLMLAHKLVAKRRGFDDVVAHDDTIINAWKEVVRAEDEVWVLGNLTMDQPEYALDVISDLPGKKFLIPGQYDDCHPMHVAAHRNMKKYRRSFEEILPYHHRRIRGQDVIVSHLPYERGMVGDLARHQQWRLRDYGHFMIHAHTQQKGRVTNQGRDIYVGVDAWDFRPAYMHEVSRLIGDAVARREEEIQRVNSSWERTHG